MAYHLGTTLESIPAAVPYIFADQGRVEVWRQRLAELDGFRIGIAWQGNPDAPDALSRSIPLAAFASLAKVPGVRLISLQKGAGAEQVAEAAASWPIVAFDDLDASGDTLMDTSAIMKCLDLVISSDTSAAHLAGALGVPVWLALAEAPDWRWLLKRARQPLVSDDAIVSPGGVGRLAGGFARMAAELQRMI